MTGAENPHFLLSETSVSLCLASQEFRLLKRGRRAAGGPCAYARRAPLRPTRRPAHRGALPAGDRAAATGRARLGSTRK